LKNTIQQENIQTSHIENLIPKTSTPKQKGPLYEILEEYKILGLLNKTYIIIETPQEMFLIDFHACAEKIAYEKLLEEYENKNISTQKLLKPQIVQLDNSEMLTCKESKEELQKLGFIFEEFGQNEILIREVPINIKGIENNPNLLKEIINEIKSNNKYKGDEKQKVEILARTACRSSIKAGYEMTTPQIKKLIEDLKTINEPFYCPHGRPTMLRFTYTQLEKKFKRIV
jgi:DNA mismatch repair protein MutL